MMSEAARLQGEQFKAEDAHNLRKAADMLMRQGRIDEVCSVERAAQDYSLAESDYEDVRDFPSARAAAKKTLAVAYDASAWRDAILLGVMFVIVVARPTGLFGKRALRAA